MSTTNNTKLYSQNHIDIEARRIVDQNITLNVSHLVEPMMRTEDTDLSISIDDIENLCPNPENAEFTVYFAGSNMPGYMPNETPALFANLADAKEHLIDQLDDASDILADQIEWGHLSSAKARSISAEVERIQEEIRKASSDFSIQYNDYAYFISSDTMSLADLIDAHDDICDYADATNEGFESIDGIDYEEPNEPLEWYVVSSWFGTDLAELGEPIIRPDANPFNEYLWGRCTSGQAIYLDGLLQTMAEDNLKHQLGIK